MSSQSISAPGMRFGTGVQWGVTKRRTVAKAEIHVPKDEEQALKTDGIIARYHALLNTPYSHPLATSGYIIGIEKSPRGKIGYPGEGADAQRLRGPDAAFPALSALDRKQQQQSFEAAFDDPKVMFVSHILRYGAEAGHAGTQVNLAHSAYSASAFGDHPAGPADASYDAGWQALDDMETRIAQDVAQAKSDGVPFTHLLFCSMGWNNDQFEAIERYNAVVHTVGIAAKADGVVFNPLVIGLTWPSVWGGTSVLDLANRGLHFASYPTKCRDADEVGYGLANHIVNAMLPRLEAATGLQSVLVGHSMGARILTRAYHSADLLIAPIARTGPGPLVIGLQAAFSANRYLADYELVPPVRWAMPGEGGPYQDAAGPGGKTVLTWSEHDKANPVARFATGAQHVGGKPGAKRIAKVPALEHLFETVELPASGDPTAIDAGCAQIKINDKVLYVDASTIIASHGDIRNPQVGALIWRAITQLGA